MPQKIAQLPPHSQKHNSLYRMGESLQINARKRGFKKQDFYKHLFYHIAPIFFISITLGVFFHFVLPVFHSLFYEFKIFSYQLELSLHDITYYYNLQ